jgi:hypothetical protein
MLVGTAPNESSAAIEPFGRIETLVDIACVFHPKSFID